VANTCDVRRDRPFGKTFWFTDDYYVKKVSVIPFHEKHNLVLGRFWWSTRKLVLRQTAEGFKTFCYPSVGLVTKTGDPSFSPVPFRAIACGFLVMQMFYNLYPASIMGIFPSFFPSAVCLTPNKRSPKVAKNP